MKSQIVGAREGLRTPLVTCCPPPPPCSEPNPGVMRVLTKIPTSNYPLGRRHNSWFCKMSIWILSSPLPPNFISPQHQTSQLDTTPGIFTRLRLDCYPPVIVKSTEDQRRSHKQLLSWPILGPKIIIEINSVLAGAGDQRSVLWVSVSRSLDNHVINIS